MPDPYLYYNSTGGRVWPNDAGVYANATKCKTANWVDTDTTEMNIIFYVACGIVFLYGMYWTTKRLKWVQEKFKQLVKKRSDAPEDVTDEEKYFLSYMEGRASKLSKHVFTWIAIAIAAEVVAANLITVYQAKYLTVPYVVT